MSYQYDCRDTSGKSVPKELFMVGSAGEIPGLKPGESREETVPVDRICDFSQPGEYEIQVSRSDVGDPKRPLVKSNIITISVISRSPFDSHLLD